MQCVFLSAVEGNKEILEKTGDDVSCTCKSVNDSCVTLKADLRAFYDLNFLKRKDCGSLVCD